MRIGWIMGSLMIAGGCDVAVSSVEGDRSSETDDDGGTVDDDGGGPGPKTKDGECGIIDIACPADKPFAGAPCEGSFSCTYGDDVATWTSTCDGTTWREVVECSDPVLGGACGGVPPAAERCSQAFSGTMEATLEMGPPPGSGPFRPFEDGELVAPEIGGQGSAMVWFVVRVNGQEPPECARVTSDLVGEVFFDHNPQVSDVKLRCGASLGMYAVVPHADCESLEEGSTFDVTFTVDVQGIGEASHPIRLRYEDVCLLPF